MRAAMTANEEDRTVLAVERTQLAWWRTGLAAVAVGVGIGRVVPELGHAGSRWPYAVLGVAFTGYGIVLIAYGHARARRAGAEVNGASVALAALGIVLALATSALIIAGA